MFLGTAVVGCSAWLAFYATEPFHRAADQVVHAAVPLAPQVLQRYAGNYELGAEVFTLTLRAGRLFVTTRDHPEIPEQDCSPSRRRGSFRAIRKVISLQHRTVMGGFPDSCLPRAIIPAK